MPGLGQLKRFNQDMLSVGDEAKKRGARGEKPITVPIPATVKDSDDSDDFVLGMPEGVSDMNGGVSMSSAQASEADVSSTAGEEADTSGEDFLGFDNASAAEDVDDIFGAFTDMASPDEVEQTNEAGSAEPAADAQAVPEDDIFDQTATDTESAGTVTAEPVEEIDNAETVNEAVPVEAETAAPVEAEAAEPIETEPIDVATAESADDENEVPVGGEESGEQMAAAESAEGDDSDDAALFDDEGEINLNEEFPTGLDNVIPDDTSMAEEAGEASSYKDAGNAGAEAETPTSGADDDFNADDLLVGIDFGDGGTGSAETAPNESQDAEAEAAEEAETQESPLDADTADATADADMADAALPEMDVPMDGIGEPSAEAVEAVPEEETLNADDLLAGLDLGDTDSAAAEPRAIDGTDEAQADSGLDVSDEEMPELSAEDAGSAAPSGEADFQTDTPDELGGAADGGGDANAEKSDADNGNADALAGIDFNMDDAGSASGIDIGSALEGLDLDGLDGGTGDGGEEASPEESAPIETFNAPEMEGVDFSNEGGGDSGFELDDNQFDIKGFTDTDVADTDNKKTAVSKSEGGRDTSGLPPNTLTDEQYAKFRKNFADYPLNVRQALENMLVQNEFTDDAQFEVIDKVLKKSSARHVASHLEKMLDVSLPVPRDYEKRTASEYAAYKSSFKYQLYNRIIPAALVCLAGVLLVIGLFLFGRKFIYKPIVANKLYKQGYALLEADEYPQSEMKFVDATKYKMVKKWFYKYARGYRDKKQYQRAEKMYKNILYCFNHDKQAGIEYAHMECDELANYEKAEEVARREVLDYHINDPDGILLLGDVFLAWGTEKDPAKFEEAKKQYALLVQLYGPTDLYMSRMMRYFIRTDNLREVLPLKEHFYTSKKANLSAEDWTELSGFMLDKLYGTLAPVDEDLRIRIEDVMDMLRRAVRSDPTNPVAMYNLSRYFVNRNSTDEAKGALTRTIELFNAAARRTARDMYKELDSYRLLGEEYAKGRDYIKAQEVYTDGITLYEKEKRNSGFKGDEHVGKMYADAGDIDYFVRADMDSAYDEYALAVDTDYDTTSIRYRLGYIHYNREEYDDAINAFIKAASENHDDKHLLLAMGNTLSLRDDNYGAQSYYTRLMNDLDAIKAQKSILLPQVRNDQAEIVDLYLKAANNLGVTQNRLARRTGNSRLNAEAMVNLTTSMRAWDALTRNQTTMMRLPGSNLAEQNLQYMTRPKSEFEPAIYTELPRILEGEAELHQ